MRIRTGIKPGEWSENEPAVGRFHGTAAWGTRGAAVIGGTNRPVPTVLTKHLRVPETASSKAARIVREAPRACGLTMPRGAKCARRAGHRYAHKSRDAMDREAIHCRVRA